MASSAPHAQGQQSAEDPIIQDEEVTVETVDDGYFVDDTPKVAAQPGILDMLVGINPWFVLVSVAVLYWIYSKNRERLHAAYADWKERREQEREVAEVKKNPDLYRAKMEAMDRARRAMQERYAEDSAAAALRAAEKEEEKRKETLEALERLQQGKGYKNKVKVEEAQFGDGVTRRAGSSSNTFRRDYNPLMGGGGSSGFRPERRNMGGRGGG